MSDFQISPEPLGWLDSVKKLVRVGWKVLIFVAGLLLTISDWQGATDYWSPWLGSRLPKLPQLISLTWLLSSPRWCFAIAAAVLGCFSFAEYHRDQMHQKSIIPLFLFICTVVSAAFAVGTWTPLPLPPGPTIERQNQQDEEIQRLRAKLEKIESVAALQVRIASDAANLDLLRPDVDTIKNMSTTYQSSCLAAIPGKKPQNEENLRGYLTPLMYRKREFMAVRGIVIQHTTELSIRENIPPLKLSGTGDFDSNKPAPGEEVFDSAEDKYNFRIEYWTCLAGVRSIGKFSSALGDKIRSLNNDKEEAETAFRSYGR